MKSKSSHLLAAIMLSLVAIIIGTASLTAQQGADPSATRAKPPTPSDAARLRQLQDVVVPPSQAPTRVADDAAFAPVPRGYQVMPGTIRRVPELRAVTSPVFPTLAMPPDAKTGELIGAYLLKQNEINQLVKKYGEATDEDAKNSLRDEIVKATAAQFDLRQQVRAWEIERLKKRLADVETTVTERNELKDKIVEKRVAEILREPDQLQWDEIATAPNGAPIFPAPIGITPSSTLPPLGPILRPTPINAYAPRVVTRIETKIIVDENGIQKKVETPVQVTVWEEVDGTPNSPPVIAPTSPAGSNPDWIVKRALETSDQRELAAAGLSVAEAEAKLRIAQQKRDVTHERYKGGQVPSTEMIASDGELELAKLVLARVKTEHESRGKLFELDVRRAESVHEEAIAAWIEAQAINKRAPNTVSSTSMRKLKADAEQASIELERAKTILDLHLKSNAPLAEPPLGPERES